jgi:hypothetical protein
MQSPNYTFLLKLPPESKSHTDTNKNTPGRTAVPGYTHLDMEDPNLVSAFLVRDLECKQLDQLAPKLWMMSTQSSANISPLTRQRVKDRQIILTEEPMLHLIWFYDKIYIKPIPRYLLSYGFWQSCLLNPKEPLGQNHSKILASALGFLRTYHYLIQHESDLRVAQHPDLVLLPATITWDEWDHLRAKISGIRDNEVSPRYRFGEIRLTRLNFYCKFFLRKPYYHRTYRQYSDYFASFYPPLLFLFAILSIMLSAMQLEAQIEQINARWLPILGSFRAFSTLVVILALILLVVLVAIFVVKFTKEWMFAIRAHYSPEHKRRELIRRGTKTLLP